MSSDFVSVGRVRSNLVVMRERRSSRSLIFRFVVTSPAMFLWQVARGGAAGGKFVVVVC